MAQLLSAMRLDAAVVLAFAAPGFACAACVWWYVLRSPDGWRHRRHVFAAMLPPLGLASFLGLALGLSSPRALTRIGVAAVAASGITALVWATALAIGPSRASRPQPDVRTETDKD